jgi:hypothetical protein
LNKLTALALACGAVFAVQAADSAAIDSVMGGGLRELVQASDAADARLPERLSRFLQDEQGNVLVEVHLKAGFDGHGQAAELAAAGLNVTAVSTLDPRRVEGYIALRDARALAGLGAVRALSAVHQPVKFAGSVQSQAVALEHADKVQAKGVDGTGIKIGALSDSYDACGLCKTFAKDDVASGDLPPDVVVLQDLKHGKGTDEGRAMLQLIYDLAPGSKLGFATAYHGEVNFSNNIMALHDTFGADVITDDVMYFEEPMFSDGLIAQTVDAVSAKGVAYFSSAGNNGMESYEADYTPVSWAQALNAEAQGLTNLKLEQIPAALRPVSLHAFTGKTTKGQQSSLFNRVTVVGNPAQFDFQWDEPFDLDKVKTDYNIYVFDTDGNWLDPKNTPFVSYTTDDNIKTDRAFEYAALSPDPTHIKGDIAQTDYQIVIAKMNNGPASHIKIVAVNTLAVSWFQGSPSTWGHSAAKGGQSIAATYYALPTYPEDFSASGPVTILFDNEGNRLALPDVRAVPQLTAADGVDNTFFGATDPDGTGKPNFFGTSAAAPDAAGVAALVLQAAGGSGSMTPDQVYTVMQQTAKQIPTPNTRDKAHGTAGPVHLQVHGDWTRWGQYFELSLDKNAGGNVAQVDLDLSATQGLVYNSILTRFYLGQSHGMKRDDITYTVSGDTKVATLAFKQGSFHPGDFFHFGTSVYFPLEGSTEEDACRMRDMKITVTMEDGTVYHGTVTAQGTMGINRWTGAGLVDAAAAVKAVRGGD